MGDPRPRQFSSATTTLRLPALGRSCVREPVMEPEGYNQKSMIMMMSPLLPGCPMKMHADSPRLVPPLVAELPPQAVPAASDGEGDDGTPSPPLPSHARWGPWAMAHRAHLYNWGEGGGPGLLAAMAGRKRREVPGEGRGPSKNGDGFNGALDAHHPFRR